MTLTRVLLLDNIHKVSESDKDGKVRKEFTYTKKVKPSVLLEMR